MHVVGSSTKVRRDMRPNWAELKQSFFRTSMTGAFTIRFDIRRSIFVADFSALQKMPAGIHADQFAGHRAGADISPTFPTLQWGVDEFLALRRHLPAAWRVALRPRHRDPRRG
jgi:hypothetical protein